MQLVIVESPHKAETIKKFLKGDYEVRASKGHIRDLPVNYMGISIANNFEPHYVITPEKKQDIQKLESISKKVLFIPVADAYVSKQPRPPQPQTLPF